MFKKILYLAMVIALCSCGEYQKVLKSHDFEYKFDYAKRAFDEKRYAQSATLFKECSTVFKGTEKAEECLFLLGMSEFENKDYETASSYFKMYYTRYPRGKYAELARFYSGYGYYLDSPDPQLDQSTTISGIIELTAFLDYFPHSDRVRQAQQAVFELQDKLTLKELQNAQLYYNLGMYMGNNYASAIIVAQNAVMEYPNSKYKEDLEMLILKSRFQEANLSVDERKADRFREVVDEYYNFTNNYPESKYTEEADNILKIANKYLKD